MLTLTRPTNENDPTMDAAPAEQHVPDPGPIVTYEETIRCPACCGLIDSACVLSFMTPRSAMDPCRERVDVWCDHCNRGFWSLYGFRNGQRVQARAIAVLDGEELDRMRMHVAAIRGDRRQTSAAGERETPPAKLEAPLVAEINASFDAAQTTGETEIVERPTVAPVDPLDTDCDTARAVAEAQAAQPVVSEVERPVRELKFDPTTSQVDFKESD